MDIRDAVGGLRTLTATLSVGTNQALQAAPINDSDPVQSFDDFITDGGNYIAVQYRGNWFFPLVVSRSDMQAIEEAMES